MATKLFEPHGNYKTVRCNGDHKPAHGAQSFCGMNSLPGVLERRREKMASRYYRAAYIGSVIYILRRHANLLTKNLNKVLGKGSLPSVMGGTLPKSGYTGLRSLIDALKNGAPDLFNQKGFGNVLEAYFAGQSADTLYNAQIMAVAEDRNLSILEKQYKLLTLHPVPKAENKPAPTKIAKVESLSVLPLLEPTSTESAIAQEEILQYPDLRARWVTVSADDRTNMVRGRVDTLDAIFMNKESTVAQRYQIAARGLIKALNAQTGSTLPVSKKPYAELVAAQKLPVRDEVEANLMQRIKYLADMAPKSLRK